MTDDKRDERQEALELHVESWALANECLNILPASDLATTGLALIHLVAVWLRATPEENRGDTYMQWLDMLHVQLDKGGVLKIHSQIEALEGQSGQVH